MVIAAAAVRASWDADEAAGDEAAPAPATATTADPAVTTTPSEGGTVTFTAPTEPAETTTTAPATTAPPPTVGESTGLPLPSAESITVGAGSSYETSFTVGAPSPDDAVRWLLDGLEADGWDVVRVTAAEGAHAVVEFRGPGARGEATVTDLAGDSVGIAVALAPPML